MSSKLCFSILLSEIFFLTKEQKDKKTDNNVFKIMSLCSSVKKTLMSSKGKTHQTSIFTQETNHGKSCRKP